MLLSRPGAPADPRFRVLWFGQAVSYLGSAVFPVALTLAMVRDAGSAGRLGLVLAAGALSEGLLLLVGGVLADRLPRHRIMSGADTVRCVGHLFLGAALLRPGTPLAALLVVSAVVGAAGGFFRPASTGLIANSVGPADLQRANAVMSVTRRTAMLAGPALATALALTVGAGWAMILDGLTFAVSAVTLTRLRIPSTPVPRTPFLRDLREGWQEVRGRQWLWSNLLVHGMWNLARTAYFTAGATLVITRLGGELSWGVVTQGATVGAFAGAVLSLRIRPRRPLVVSNLCLAVGGAALVLVAAEAPVWLIAVAAAVMNLGLGLMSTLWDTTVQREVPDEKLARVASFDWLLSTALSPLGMALAGPLTAAVGARSTLWGAAALMVVPSLGVLALREVRRPCT
ncbi:MFS transporter [Kitasatospora sp. NPDC002227]|uniref:MFS transporter n=1 Tax=Kitasatospora sp. NPDC002227 TaxID=3154773 RepID=UPI003328268F